MVCCLLNQSENAAREKVLTLAVQEEASPLGEILITSEGCDFGK